MFKSTRKYIQIYSQVHSDVFANTYPGSCSLGHNSEPSSLPLRSSEIRETTSESFGLYYLKGRRISGIEEVFKVLPLPSQDVPSQGQQHPIFNVHSVNGTLLPLCETPDGGPEFPQRSPWPHRTPPTLQFLTH